MAIKIPAFTTNCQYETEMDGGTWYIYLKSSGSSMGFPANRKTNLAKIFL